jgi:hypothetical protein
MALRSENALVTDRTPAIPVSLSRAGHERGHEAQALWLLGEIASHGEPPDVEKAEN